MCFNKLTAKLHLITTSELPFCSGFWKMHESMLCLSQFGSFHWWLQACQRPAGFAGLPANINPLGKEGGIGSQHLLHERELAPDHVLECVVL